MAVLKAMAAEAERWLDPGGWLVAHRWEMDRGESAWLEALATFDRKQRWADDGQLLGTQGTNQRRRHRLEWSRLR